MSEPTQRQSQFLEITFMGKAISGQALISVVLGISSLIGIYYMNEQDHSHYEKDIEVIQEDIKSIREQNLKQVWKTQHERLIERVERLEERHD